MFCLAVLLFQLRPAVAAEPRDDDAWTRMQSRIRREGLLSPEQLVQVERIARGELSRAPRAGFRSALVSTPITPGALVNVGPIGAAFEYNDVKYPNVDSGRARTIIPHPIDKDILYFATAGGGVWKTFDATASQPHWESITDGIVALGTGSLALDPNVPDSLVLGLGDPFDIPFPGVYVSDSGGAFWDGPTILTGCYFGVGCGLPASTVRDVKFNGASSGVVLAATDIGLFRNTDHGIGSWTQVALPDASSKPDDCFSLAYVGGQTWLLACTDDVQATGAWGAGSLWRSTDDGASWGPVTPLPTADVGNGVTGPGRMTIAAAMGNTDVASARIYVLCSDSSGFAQLDVYKSVDGGQHFTGLGVNMHGAPTNPDTSFNRFQIDLNVMHGQAWYNQAILAVAGATAAQDTIFVGGNFAMVRSKDGGATWDVVSDWLPYTCDAASCPSTGAFGYNYLGIPYVHADFHAMAVGTAGAAPVFYAGTDGGIFRSTDVFTAAPGQQSATAPGHTVSPTFDDSMNKGLSTHLMYKVCAGSEALSAPDVISGGLQDNGSRKRNSTTPTEFDQITGGDGIGCGLGKAGGTGAFGSLVITTYPGWISRSTDSGATFNDAVTGLPAACTQATPAGTYCLDQNSNFHMQVATDPTDTSRQTFLTPVAGNFSGGAASTSHVFRTVDGAANWVDITGTVNGSGPFAKPLTGVAAHPTSPGKYVAWSSGRMFITTSANTGTITWTMSPTGGPISQQPISSAIFDLADTTGATLWITTHDGPSGAGHVFKVTNATSATPTLTDMSGGSGSNPLPDVPHTVVAMDQRDSTHNTLYVGTDIGLYGTTDGGSNWHRYGSGMPAVKISDLSIAADGTSLRIATYGRGFWELYPKASVPAGVLANGDHNANGIIDGDDLVFEAAALDLDVTSPKYDPASNLTGTTNAITWDDMLQLLAKFGGRP